jgi:L-histidine Nalpha-methyltransferase
MEMRGAREGTAAAPAPGAAAARLRASGAPIARMAEEIRASLGASPPWIPSIYLYDDRGSELFEAITRLPEYYQTRTEAAILRAVAGQVVSAVRPRELVELGSGAGRKVRMLLDAMVEAGVGERCLLLDVNDSFVAASAQRLAMEYPGLAVRGVVGDFTRDLDLLEVTGDRLVVLFAGTIGNLHPDEVPRFLAGVGRLLEDGGAFLVGVDLLKDAARLEAAYNDAAGVTAAFNLNVLRVLNRDLGADFELDAFEHVAFLDRERSWIEMRVRSLRDQVVRVPACEIELALAAGDEIRTEISCKYSRASFGELLGRARFALSEWFTDRRGDFALALAAPDRTA